MAAHWPPRVGDVVHYVSHGSPVLPDGTQRYPSACRAAIVTLVDTYQDWPPGHHIGHVGLAVLNPTGAFFDQGVFHGVGDPADDAPGARCHTGGRAYPAGTWHVPETGD
ncbi:hypothetical protein ACOQFV_27370 [Nocardiopsis changdeensis]|uniref:Uncharacterized protein n=1 Tax=Nocardiopsis changdeensis TaxID=2831969 RepID=A0ABX8BLR4_9ACTN|nr:MULTISPECIES: hypothetical protein [Nocardiopsis]QUX22989.1 hypothetical protein KGD84_00830 [Nocardiopsis changdeensis]QYX38932.1 hypothetical protein K1J57_10280 [Nocardiopsis sp. MT53]